MKNKLSSKKINQIKEYFLNQKKILISSLSLNNNSNFIENYGDEGDLAQANIINFLQAKLSERELFKLKKINNALHKIENSQNFGVCEECEEIISEKRIMALPGCSYCISCAEIEEKNNKINNL